MQHSGLILDVYDDVDGSTLKSLFPTQESIPPLVKQAHALTPQELSKLPDDVFALVMVDSGEKFRKYACVDSGNTMLSVAYFLQNQHKLPEEAQKVAASNLKIACGWYDLPVPEVLEKAAIGLMTALSLPSTIKGTSGAVKGNLQDVRQMERAARAGGAHLNEAIAVGMHPKHAEVVGTPDMPNSPSKLSETPKRGVTTIRKTSAGHLIASNHETDVPPDTNIQNADKQPQVLSQMHMAPVVHVANLKAPVTPPKKKEAQYYAIPEHKMYPLDSYVQVKLASEYLDSHWEDIATPVRREYAVNLTKRAEELSIPLSERISSYGSEKLASPEQFAMAIATRLNNTQEELHELLGKVASAYSTVSAELLSQVLYDFDKLAGITHLYNKAIPDPIESTYAPKEAEKNYSDVIGNLSVTGKDLKELAVTGHTKLKSVFGEDFFQEFRKDPIGIYSSMPAQERKLIIRMATENSPGVELLR